MPLLESPHIRARRERLDTLIEIYRCNRQPPIIPGTDPGPGLLNEAKQLVAEYIGDVATSHSDGDHVRHRPVVEICESLVELGWPPPIRID